MSSSTNGAILAFKSQEGASTVDFGGALPSGLEASNWKPTFSQALPPSISARSFYAWYLLHTFRLMKSQSYGALLIHQNDRLIHRSIIYPAHFRYPFMQANDVEIGSVWTEPDQRGKGLAVCALQLLVQRFARIGSVWYFTRDANTSSIRVAKKSGLVLVGELKQRKLLGRSLFSKLDAAEGSGS
jgi:RimJ/RimL family protein N-acetyltransferase